MRKQSRFHAMVISVSLMAVHGGFAEDSSCPEPAPHGAVPSARQLVWQKLELCGFVHFGMPTFGPENYGSESPELFNPTELDALQWALLARDAGMKGLVMTAKHHGGFCLWPSQYTDYSVKRSPWKDGKGDVIREVSDACREVGIKFGFYLSPHDRSRSDFGQPEYVEYYYKQTEELLTQYGDVFEVWHDGNLRKKPYYYGGANEVRSADLSSYYRWPRTYELIRQHQPDAVIFSDGGPDIRWVGNEKGYSEGTSWAAFKPEGFHPGVFNRQRLAQGWPDGTVWRPIEVDVSLRENWHFRDDDEAKSLEKLLDIYYSSVGFGAGLLLNLSPDKRGLIIEDDAAQLLEFSAAIAKTFETDLAQGRRATASQVRGSSDCFAAKNAFDGDRDSYWAVDDGVQQASITVELDEMTSFNRIRLQEQVRLGQRIAAFSIDAHTEDGWQQIAEGTTIGIRRILRVPDTTADRVRLNISESLACPTISTFELYRATTEN